MNIKRAIFTFLMISMLISVGFVITGCGDDPPPSYNDAPPGMCCLVEEWPESKTINLGVAKIQGPKHSDCNALFTKATYPTLPKQSWACNTKSNSQCYWLETRDLGGTWQGGKQLPTGVPWDVAPPCIPKQEAKQYASRGVVVYNPDIA